MRVLQVHSPYREYGGEDRVVALEAEALRGAGHEVQQYLVRNPPGTARSVEALLHSVDNRQAAQAVRELVTATRPDVAHVHNTWFSLSASVVPALRDAGVPVVATMHNYRTMCIASTLFRDGHECHDCVGRSPLSGVRHACYAGSRVLSGIAAAGVAVHKARQTWRQQADVVLLPTPEAREVFLADGFPPDRVRVKSNFTADPGPRLAPPSRSRTVLYVGRLLEEKGVRLLLEAWRQARPDGLELVVVGEGPQRPLLEALGAPDVHFTGRLGVAEVTARMLSARALVFPSVWREPFGLTSIEAMAAGLPVVAFDVAGMRRILAPSEEGLLARVGDVAELARSLDRLTDDALVDRVGVCSRERYASTFTPEATLPELERAYADALSRAALRR